MFWSSLSGSRRIAAYRGSDHVCLYAGKEAGVGPVARADGSCSLKKAAGFADTFSLCFIPVCCFFVRYSVGASGEIRWKT